MKLDVKIVTNLKVKEVQDAVEKATSKALKTVITDIANDAIKDSPVLTGNNRRSIAYEVEGGEVGTKEGQAATYSTSGYGGFLETGTSKMPARPYFKPALDRHINKLVPEIRKELG